MSEKKEDTPGWGPSIMPETVSENRRRAMQSNLFSDQTASFVAKNKQISNSPPQNSSHNYEPPPRPIQPTFPDLPELSSISNPPEVPALSPFPDFSLDIGKITDSFDLGVKPRPPVEAKPIRKLNFTTSNQMKLMRDELARDFSEFSKRMKRLGTSNTIKMDTIKFPAPPAIDQDDEEFDAPIPTEEFTKPQNLNTTGKKNLNFSQSQKMSIEEDETPTFTTVSEFLLPDGTRFE